MELKIKHTSERNGYRIEVAEYMRRGEKRYSARITNLTTCANEECPSWSSYRTALEVAQQTADEAKI